MKPQLSQSQPLVEGLDYYLENGFFVFTAHYLLQRGYCCRSGCRHCPYGFKKGDTGTSAQKENASTAPSDES